MIEVRQIESDRLSHFHTKHRLLHYGEFTNVDEFLEYKNWAQDRNLPIFILGNGSNILFPHRTVRTLVLKNKLTGWMKPLDAHRIEVSSSLNVSVILKYCQKNHLDSFYYLASVPATVGGAIAMNAGRGRSYNKNIFDYLESVTFIDGNEVFTRQKTSIAHSYRQTEFTGIQDKLIVSAVFQFEESDITENLIMQRIDYSKQEQDLSGPNCGSVFKSFHPGILRRLRGFRLGRTFYSKKTMNWIINRSASPRYVRALIIVAKLAHRLIGRRAELEIIEVP